VKQQRPAGPEKPVTVPPPTRAMAKARYMALGIYYPKATWEERPWGDRKAWLHHETKMREALRSLGYIVVRARSRGPKKTKVQP